MSVCACGTSEDLVSAPDPIDANRTEDRCRPCRREDAERRAAMRDDAEQFEALAEIRREHAQECPWCERNKVLPGITRRRLCPTGGE